MAPKLSEKSVEELNLALDHHMSLDKQSGIFTKYSDYMDSYYKNIKLGADISRVLEGEPISLISVDTKRAKTELSSKEIVFRRQKIVETNKSSVYNDPYNSQRKNSRIKTSFDLNQHSPSTFKKEITDFSRGGSVRSHLRTQSQNFIV